MHESVLSVCTVVFHSQAFCDDLDIPWHAEVVLFNFFPFFLLALHV